MAIAVQAQSNTAWANGNGVTIAKPSGFTVGEVLIASIFTVGDPSPGAWTIPTGWVQIRTDANGSSGNTSTCTSFSKVYDPSDASATNYAFSNGTAAQISGGIIRFSGVNTNTPVFVKNGATGSTTTPSYANTITPSANDMLVFLVVTNSGVTTGTFDGTANVASVAIVTSNPTWTRQFSLNGAGVARSTAAAFTGPRSAATATGNGSAALGGNYSNPIDSIGQIIALSPQIFTTVTDTEATSDKLLILVNAVVKETQGTIDSILVVFGTAWTNLQKSAQNLWNNLTKS